MRARSVTGRTVLGAWAEVRVRQEQRGMLNPKDRHAASVAHTGSGVEESWLAGLGVPSTQDGQWQEEDRSSRGESRKRGNASVD